MWVVSAASVAKRVTVVLLVDHDEFDLDEVARRAPFVLDTRHVLSGPAVEHL